jgi:peptidyl-prolyl cis-trans isomerase B (cyclophilin B)
MKKFLLALAAPFLALILCLPALAADQAYVKLSTTKGDIVLEIDKAKAPVTAQNFLKNVQDGYYDGLIFHRVISGFMIQAGGFDKDMHQKAPTPSIKNEADNGLKNLAYTVAMARTSDPDSASSQFFINVADNKALDFTGKTQEGWGYAVFGKVVKGKEVVEAIKAVPTTAKGMYRDVPVDPVVIQKAQVVPQP